jgi:hypothetical protein
MEEGIKKNIIIEEDEKWFYKKKSKSSKFNFCEHWIIKSKCDQCNKKILANIPIKKEETTKNKTIKKCRHGNLRKDCQDCIILEVCVHRKIKVFCQICKGIKCEHGKKIIYCIDCDGSGLCNSEWCESIGLEKYNGYCLRCCVYLFPELKVVRNYKTKEKAVVDFIKEKFINYDWVYDKKIKDGCSRKRPDLLLDLGSHLLIVEVDENAHNHYDCSCENKRLMQLSQDVGHRPIVFIRFNPDDYIDNDGNKVKSCWILDNKKELLVIDPNKLDEWKQRLSKLKQQVKYWVDNPSEKMIEIIQLFY